MSNSSKRAAITRKLSGPWHTEETKRNISINNKSGTDEIRRKISNSLSGRSNPEHSARQKLKFKDITQHPRTKKLMLVYPDGTNEIIWGLKALYEKCDIINISSNTLLKNIGNTVTKVSYKRDRSTLHYKLVELLKIQILNTKEFQNEK
jgi:hypothetical protein